MLFDNRWNQHTYTTLMLLPFGFWAPGERYLTASPEFHGAFLWGNIVHQTTHFKDFAMGLKSVWPPTTKTLLENIRAHNANLGGGWGDSYV